VRRGRASAVAHCLIWVAWGVLVVQQLADAWLHQAPWIVWLAYCLPLLIFLPGMLRDKLRSYIWLCFISLLYFTRLVVNLFAEPGSALAQQMATKLDLARGYIDLGVKDGARELLDEVMRDGTREQRQAAVELIKQIEG